MEIKIKYFNNDAEEIKKIEKGDWIDLRCEGAKRVDIINSQVSTYKGLPLLNRHSKKYDMSVNEGYIVDEEGNYKEIKYIEYNAGDFLMLDLGVAMELPKGYEAHLVPRGSTFKNFSIIETNSMGVVDESYKGDNDRWFMPVYAMQDGFIIMGERVCQFRVEEKMEKIDFIKVDKLENEDRGGHGSTGTK